jgi:hypothetical protein
MSYRERSHWLLLTQEELNAKPTRELLAILQWARYVPKCSCGQMLGDCDGGLTEDERQRVQQRFALKIRTKTALNTQYDGVVRGHVPGRAEGKKIRRDRQARKERKQLEY